MHLLVLLCALSGDLTHNLVCEDNALTELDQVYLFHYFLGPTCWIHLKRFLIPCNFGLKNKNLGSIIFPKMLRSHERQLKTTKTLKTIQVVDHWPKLLSVLIKGALAAWNWVRTKERGRILWGSGASLPQKCVKLTCTFFWAENKALTNSGRGFLFVFLPPP